MGKPTLSPDYRKKLAKLSKQIIGEIYGKLTIQKAWFDQETGKMWVIGKCTCGTKVTRPYNTVKNGNRKSCGQWCSAGKDSPFAKRAQKRIGERYNRLTIIGLEYIRKRRNFFVVCRCDCGNIVSKVYAKLKCGDIQSCGCYRRENASRVATRLQAEQKAKFVTKEWLYRSGDKTIPMRSSYEVMFAEILDARGVEWEYEPRYFRLNNGVRYIPDFRVGDRWFEVKGFLRPESKIKIDQFIRQGYDLTLVTLEDIEKEHPLTYRQFLKAYAART